MNVFAKYIKIDLFADHLNIRVCVHFRNNVHPLTGMIVFVNFKRILINAELIFIIVYVMLIFNFAKDLNIIVIVI